MSSAQATRQALRCHLEQRSLANVGEQQRAACYHFYNVDFTNRRFGQHRLDSTPHPREARRGVDQVDASTHARGIANRGDGGLDETQRCAQVNEARIEAFKVDDNHVLPIASPVGMTVIDELHVTLGLVDSIPCKLVLGEPLASRRPERR